MSGFNPRYDYMLGEEEALRSRVGGTGSAQTLGMSEEERERAKDKQPVGFHAPWPGEDPGGPPRPGEVCICGRRVPFPKTEKTPPTKKKAYWVPADEHEAHEDVLETAAKHLGTFERPFWEFATATLALALVLQDESLRGFAHRNPHSREYEVPERAEPETQGLA